MGIVLCAACIPVLGKFSSRRVCTGYYGGNASMSISAMIEFEVRDVMILLLSSKCI